METRDDVDVQHIRSSVIIGREVYLISPSDASADVGVHSTCPTQRRMNGSVGVEYLIESMLDSYAFVASVDAGAVLLVLYPCV